MASKCVILLLLLIVVLLNASVYCNADYILEGGDNLNPGDSLKNGNYELMMQKDCNLVLYDDGKPTWASNTVYSAGGPGYCICTLQSDGNLEVYNSVEQEIVWSSNTGGDKGYEYLLVLEKEGNLVIYRGSTAIWTAPKVKNAKQTGIRSSIIKTVTSN